VILSGVSFPTQNVYPRTLCAVLAVLYFVVQPFEHSRGVRERLRKIETREGDNSQITIIIA
jgi:hypothetical protein